MWYFKGEKIKAERLFKKVRQGEFFTHNGDKYIRTFPMIDDIYGDINAIKISTGEPTFFDFEDLVIIKGFLT